MTRRLLEFTTAGTAILALTSSLVMAAGATVYDSKNAVVGTLVSNTQFSGGPGAYVERQIGIDWVAIPVNQNGLLTPQWNTSNQFFYTTSDCSGTAYVQAGFPLPTQVFVS